MIHAQAASAVIRKTIEGSQGPLPPPFIVQFLLDHWRRYLAIVHRDHGEVSGQWVAAISQTEQLLWSVAPKSNGGERTVLMKSLEALLPALKQGMATAGCEAPVQAAFMRQLADYHLALIHPQGASAEAAKTPLQDAAHAPKVNPEATLTIDLRDPRYNQLFDMLNSDNVEQIDI